MATYLLVALVGFAFVLMLTLHIFLLRWGFVSGGRHWLTDEAITGDDDVEMQTRQVAAAHGLLPGDVEKLPSYNYNSGGVEGEGVYTGAAASTTCAICLENFSFGDKCRLLPQCKHSFHADCVDSWLMKSALCPVCRGGVELVAEDTVPAKAREVCDV